MRFGQLDKVSFMLYDQANRLSVAWRGQGGAALLFTLLAMEPAGRSAGSRVWNHATALPCCTDFLGSHNEQL